MLSGYGLHTGVHSQVWLHRTEGGVRFLRNGVEIPVLLESVIGTPHCTILGKDEAKVVLVEHLLAALHVTGWWQGVLIEISGDEVPILDGSAQGWLGEITELGTPPVTPVALEVTRGFRVQGSGSGKNPDPRPPTPDPSLAVSPGPTSLSVSVDYPHPVIGSQQWSGTPEDFHELLSARTFGFLKDYERLRSQGLASQVTLENAIVFDDSGPLSPLRFPNEPVRHKALDVIGDFFLLGKPLVGKLEVARGSHAAHVFFMKQLLASNVLREVQR